MIIGTYLAWVITTHVWEYFSVQDMNLIYKVYWEEVTRKFLTKTVESTFLLRYSIVLIFCFATNSTFYVQMQERCYKGQKKT